VVVGRDRAGRRLPATVIERLGTLAGGVIVNEPPSREAVPDWLANRLIHTAGMNREDAAAMDLLEAVELWTTFTSTPPDP
jgi:mRNA interferase RelE/StbE